MLFIGWHAKARSLNMPTACQPSSQLSFENNLQ